ncbi:MAG: hypothetical protein SPI30_09005 [Prevotella sp.]|nr:hypothetical protein [Prevotella sp.]
MKNLKATIYLTLFVLLLFSCDRQIAEDKSEEGTSHLMSISLGGEFIKVTDSLMKCAPSSNSKTLYGINVLRKKSSEKNYTKYAYGLFDDPSAMQILLTEGYLYSFECTTVKGLEDSVYHANRYYASPFLHATKSPTLLANQFVFSTTANLTGIGKGHTKISESDSTNYPRTDRYFGTLSDFEPASATSITINLNRAVFGLHFDILPPPDGTLSISCSPATITVSSSDQRYDKQFIYAFSQTSAASAEGYNGNITVTLEWVRGNGETIRQNKSVNIKRNVMTTIKIDASSARPGLPIHFNEEDKEMGHETVEWYINQ